MTSCNRDTILLLLNVFLIHELDKHYQTIASGSSDVGVS